ncbi:MAG TPA: MBL fold metallo-hydrolase [Myxococcota bacterium]|nr:MBL fold metallo-hydrolase [Myxococcota bacterium]HRY93602.1 MBL fold metallo-hydrolase [Myxococcota bacterium]
MLLGVIISHPHQDHWGLVTQVSPRVPIFMGEAAHRILREALFFSSAGADIKPAGFLRDRTSFHLGPFTITPYLMDHSAFDAYALLVEADGGHLFYTGDLRGHGRKAALFERLLREPPSPIDTLLMEGTLVGAEMDDPRGLATEADVEHECIALFKETQGLALAAYSSQNIDRLVTLYRATIQADRDFVMDLYTATVAVATGHPTIPRPGWERVRVFVPFRQRLQVKESGDFSRVDSIKVSRIFPEELASTPAKFVLTFRASMSRDLERAKCLLGARLIWSLWRGYLEADNRTRAFCQDHGITIHHVHSSGHAFVHDLQRLADALKPRVVVPIHTTGAKGFEQLFEWVALRPDRTWWEV